jgi:hypothetical protein
MKTQKLSSKALYFFLSPFKLLKHKADVTFVNEHGNTPLHYACFWNYPAIAEDLVEYGAPVTKQNKYGETPLDKCQGHLAKRLQGKTTLTLFDHQESQDVPFLQRGLLSSDRTCADRSSRTRAG